MPTHHFRFANPSRSWAKTLTANSSDANTQAPQPFARRGLEQPGLPPACFLYLAAVQDAPVNLPPQRRSDQKYLEFSPETRKMVNTILRIK